MSSSQQCPEPQLPVLRPQCLLKMCQTPSVIPSSQHPSAAPAPRAQLLPEKEQHRDRLGCDTAAQHPQGSDHFSFRLDGKTRTEQPLSVAHPQEAWTSPAFGSLKAASPCPHSYLLMVRDTSPSEPSSARSSQVTDALVVSAAASQEPPQPAGIVCLPPGLSPAQPPSPGTQHQLQPFWRGFLFFG